jgi:shikimate dehydrogenase
MNARYAVFGQPIAHSLSPRIHALFGTQLGIAIDYRAIEAGRDDFPHALAAFAADGGRGANVTLPLKEDAAALCADASPRARACGSVNTLVRVGAAWFGDSTDGIGWLRDLRERHGLDPRNRRIVLLGAGGAARAVAFALVAAEAAQVIVTNRTPERAQALASALGARACAMAWDDVSVDGIDLLVNATAAGHGDTAFDLPFERVPASLSCYDLSYGKAAAPFLAWARAAGAARVSDGLGMLVEQAAESFAIWHGPRPQTEAVYRALCAYLETKAS